MAPTPSKEVINIGGVAANVYSLPGATETSTPVAVLFFLHGRTQRATDYEWVAYSTLDRTNELRGKAGKQGQDLIVVLLVRYNQIALDVHVTCR